ncbi:MAG: LD-carboxypeptidase [Candidatus Spechtbacterales bacterium]|nr:LD-carboxypeptidase [Candidatus Spechtbacterales bacterium]
MNIIKPHKLNPGDKVGIISPSNPIKEKRENFLKAKENFEKQLNLKLVFSDNAFNQYYYSAGTTQERIDDFHSMLEDDDIGAILFSVGGDTAIDLLPHLNFELIREKRKIISGISDATTLLHSITAKTGLITHLGIELHYYEDQDLSYQNDSIKRAWFDGNLEDINPNSNWKDLRKTYNQYAGWQTIKKGKAKGMFVGGNFSSFMQLVNTEYALPFEDNLLFFETYKYPKKLIHKALKQLELHGILEKISGMVIGYLLDSENPKVMGNEQPLKELVLEVVDEYDFPVMQIGEIGHQVENFIQPIGAKVEMDVSKLSLKILETVAD